MRIHHRRWTSRGLAFLVLTLLWAGCDNDEGKGYAPDDCQRVKPSTGYLVVQCTINSAHPSVPIQMYRGDYDEGTVVLRDTLVAPETEFEMPVGTRYAVMARYLSGADTVLVLDTAELGVSSDDYEDATCYYVKTKRIDVRLKD